MGRQTRDAYTSDFKLRAVSLAGKRGASASHR